MEKKDDLLQRRGLKGVKKRGARGRCRNSAEKYSEFVTIYKAQQNRTNVEDSCNETLCPWLPHREISRLEMKTSKGKSRETQN